MNEQIEKIIEKLVGECLNTPAFSILNQKEKSELAEKLTDHFYGAVFATFLEKIDGEAAESLNHVDLTSQEGQELIEVIAASTPGLLYDVEQRLYAEQDKILTTQKIPEISLEL